MQRCFWGSHGNENTSMAVGAPRRLDRRNRPQRVGAGPDSCAVASTTSGRGNRRYRYPHSHDRQGALPVQSITQEQIQQSGAATPEQFLHSVSVAVQGNTNVVAASGAGATSGGVSGVSLRGLGSQRTLVLINGKRVSGGGAFAARTTVD